jgi:hypothetical protein
MWTVSFSTQPGSNMGDSWQGRAFVRCVRGLSDRTTTPAQHYVVDAQANTVRDTSTGLTWQQTLDAATYDFDAAKSACLALGNSYRLPTLNELLSIVDPLPAPPSIQSQVFPGTPQATFWTASASTLNGAQAWTVSFLDGISTPVDKTTRARIRCVR